MLRPISHLLCCFAFWYYLPDYFSSLGVRCSVVYRHFQHLRACRQGESYAYALAGTHGFSAYGLLKVMRFSCFSFLNSYRHADRRARALMWIATRLLFLSASPSLSALATCVAENGPNISLSLLFMLSFSISRHSLLMGLWSQLDDRCFIWAVFTSIRLLSLSAAASYTPVKMRHRFLTASLCLMIGGAHYTFGFCFLCGRQMITFLIDLSFGPFSLYRNVAVYFLQIWLYCLIATLSCRSRTSIFTSFLFDFLSFLVYHY